MRILAVDDDPLILELLPVVFRQANFPQISVASSGAAALELLNDPDEHFDCLLLDIEMPEMTGIILCERIRQLSKYRSTPILMLTSVTDHARVERAFAAGANDYISKPFDVKEIATRVRVAERMVASVSNVARFEGTDAILAAGRGQHNFAVDMPVELASIPQLILPFSLGNYLSQLARSKIDACQVFAVHVEAIEDLYTQCNSREFVSALSKISQAIIRVADYPHMLMAYSGNGVFLCITQGVTVPDWPGIEEDIYELLHDGTALFDDGTAMNLDVSVGNPITPFASRTQRVKKTFERAIDRAMMRGKAKRAQRRVE